MKSIQQKLIQAENQLAKQQEIIKRLKEQIEKEKIEQDFQIIKYKGKEYRIYKWEDKPIKDFVCPKGFEMAGALDLIELINEKKLIGELGCSYFAKKLFEKGYWDLFGAYLYRGGGWCASDGNLADSDDDGRVVLMKVKK